MSLPLPGARISTGLSWCLRRRRTKETGRNTSIREAGSPWAMLLTGSRWSTGQRRVRRTEHLPDRIFPERRPVFRQISGLKLQKAQERVQEIQEEADGYLLRSDVKPMGETVEIAGWRITLNQVEEKKRLETSNMYFEADEDKIFARMDMDVENLRTEKARFLETIVTKEDLLIHLVSSAGRSDWDGGFVKCFVGAR